MATLFVDKVDPQSGTSLEIGSSGDTITIPSGATITNNGTQTGFGGTNTPAFEAFLSSDTSQLSNDTDTKIVFDTEIHDTNSTYDVSNGRFTPAVAGTYLIYGSIIFDDSNADLNAEHIVKIFKNGSQDSVFFHLPNMKDSIITYNITYVLDDNDYIEIFGKINNSDGARIINGAAANQKGTTFGAFKIIT